MSLGLNTKHITGTFLTMLLIGGLAACGGGGGGGSSGGSGGSSSSSSGSSSSSAATTYTGSSEFLVNTKVVDSQRAPSATTLTNGNVVVTWVDDLGTIGGFEILEIRAQIFTASGTKVGSEILVSPSYLEGTGLYYHVEPRVVALSDGNFSIIWRSSATTPTLHGGLNYMRFDSTGTKQSSASVNIGDAMDARPDAVFLNNGNILLLWHDYGHIAMATGGTDLQAMIIDIHGNTVVDIFDVATNTAGQQSHARAAVLQSGDFIITWTDRSGTLGDSSESSIKAQKFKSDGTKDGSELLVNTRTEQTQALPDITPLNNGGFVIVWDDRNASDADVRGQLFTASASKQGSEFLVNTNTNLRQLAPTAFTLPNGNFVVAWSDNGSLTGDNSDYGIKAQLYKPDGSKLNNEFAVNSQIQNAQIEVSGTALSTNGFFMVWQDNSGTLGDSSGTSIKGRIFAPN